MQLAQIVLSVLVFTLVVCDPQALEYNKLKQGQTDSHTVKEYSVSVAMVPVNGRLFVRVESATNDFLALPVVALNKGGIYFDCMDQSPVVLCMVPTEDLQQDDRFEVDVNCLTDCNYTIVAYVDRYYKMKLGESFMIGIDRDGQQFEATVDVDVDSFSEVRVLATLDNPEEVDGALALYGNAGDSVQPPSVDVHQLEGKFIWNDGLGLFVSRQAVKSKQSIKLLLVGRKDMEILIECYTVNNNKRSISLEHDAYDEVRKDQTNLYILDLSSLTSSELQGQVYFKLTKYTGKSRILLAPDESFTLNKTTEGVAFRGITQVVLTKKLREEMGYKDKVVIAVSGDYDSTYRLQANVDRRGFTMLNNDVAEVSTLIGKDVDNYIYIFKGDVAKDRSDKLRNFSLGAQVYTQELEYGVRICNESKGFDNCILSTVDDVLKAQQSFNEISGSTHENNAIKYFTFSYDITKCRGTGGDTCTCTFQVVCFNPNKTEKPMTYMINFAEIGVESNLQEGVPRKDRIEEGEIKRYLLALAHVEDVAEVHLLLTVISGDCLLWATTLSRDLNMTDIGVEIGMNDTLLYTKDIKGNYYVRVQAYTPSYYSLTAVIKRKNNGSTDDKSSFDSAVVQLTEGPSQISFINSTQRSQSFYIQLRKPTVFSIDVSTIKGSVDFTVYPSDGEQIKTGRVWKSEGDNHLSISDVESYSSGNEFIVVVTGGEDAVFDISYNRDNKCPLRNLGRVANIDVDPVEERCSSYLITRMDDIEIVLASAYFAITTGNMNVTVDWNGNNTRLISNRITTINATEINNNCPAASNSGIRPDCIMSIRFNAFEGATVATAVQFTRGELELFDGLQQYVKGALSNSSPRYFVYNMANSKPLMVSIRSQSDTKYRIVGKLTTWKDYLNSNATAIYPAYADDTLSAETNNLGSTALVVRTPDLATSNAKEILLLSVYSTGSEASAQFRIEVTQHISKLHPSETKQSFVEKDNVLQYEVRSDGSKQLIVHANSYNVYCARLELMAKQDGAINTTVLSKSLTGEIMISPSEKPIDYVIEVTGVSDCAFQLSYSPVDEKVYELVSGHMFSTELKQGDKLYFLYYNTRKESFRVVAQSDYGQVGFNAKTITQDQVVDISSTIAGVNGRWEFGGPSHDASLLVLDSSQYFCTDCYYLIEVTSASSAAFIIVLHSINSPIPMRENRVTRQTLTAMSPSIRYAYLKMSPFKLPITVLFGNLEVEVTVTTDKTVNITQSFSTSTTIDVPYNGTTSSGENLYDDEAFLIKITCKQSCSYTLTIDSSSYPRKLIEGMPYTLEVNNASTGQCVQFLSLEKNTSTYVHMSTVDTNNFKYDVRCFNKDTWIECQREGSLVIKENRNKEDLNIEMKSLRGYYLICMTVYDEKKPQNVTVMHSYNVNFRFVMAYSDNLMSNADTEQAVLLEMYNPTSESVLVELFECSGEVDFEATSDYKRFIDSKASIAEHSKTAGHYVVRLDSADVPYSMMFSRVAVKNTRTNPNATFLFRYSFFKGDQYPYAALGPDTSHIAYQFADDKIHFTVDHIKANSFYNVVSYKYMLFASKSPADLKQAVQCGTTVVYSTIVNVSPNEALDLTTITFEISRDTAESIVDPETDYLYISASCWVEVVDSSSDEPGSRGYRFVYDTVQMTLVNPGHNMANFKMKVKFFFLWVIFPVLISAILLFFSVKYCVGKVKQLPHSELIEQEQEEVNYTQNPQGTTAKHLVGTSVDVSSRPKFDEA